MSKLNAALIFLGTLFIIIFFVDYIFIKRRYIKRIIKKKKIKKNNELTELSYLIAKFNLDKSKLPLNSLVLVISIINAFIISLVATLVLMVRTYIVLQLLLGFVLLIALIYAIYELLGRYLERRGFSKNGK